MLFRKLKEPPDNLSSFLLPFFSFCLLFSFLLVSFSYSLSLLFYFFSLLLSLPLLSPFFFYFIGLTSSLSAKRHEVYPHYWNTQLFVPIRSSTRYSRMIIIRLYVNKIRVTTSMSSIIIPCSSRFTSNGNASEREIKLRW